MIEESGRVVAVESAAVWVETRISSTCSGCSVRSGCGQGLADRLGIHERRGLIRARCDFRLDIGDSVVIGIHEGALLRGAVLVYLFPLLALFAAATVAAELGMAEPYVIFTGALGFFASCVVVRRHSQRAADDPALQPVVLRAVLAATPG